jgi:hypothetical protein
MLKPGFPAQTVTMNVIYSILDPDELFISPTISSTLSQSYDMKGGGLFSVFLGDRYPLIHNPEMTGADMSIEMTIEDAMILERFMHFPPGGFECRIWPS